MWAGFHEGWDKSIFGATLSLVHDEWWWQQGSFGGLR
jgi:hypothetical protein